MKFIEYLKEIDMFSSPMSVKFNGKDSYSTYLGGFLTIGIIVMTIVFIITTGENFYKKINPVVNNNILYLETPGNYSIIEKEFYPIFTLSYNHAKIINEEYFSIKILQYRRELVNNTFVKDRIELDWEVCGNNPNHLNYFNKYANFTKSLSANNFNKSICLAETEKNNITIGGEYNSGFFSNFYIQIEFCNNNTSICKDIDEIYDSINDVNIELAFPNFAPNINQLHNPFFTTYGSYFIRLDPYFYSTVDAYFIPLKIESDIGILFTDKLNENRWKFQYAVSQQQFIVNRNEEKRLLRFFINIGKTIEKIERYYMKIQDLTAYVGGLLEVFMLACSILTGFLNRFLCEEDMINALYVIKDESEGNISKIKKNNINNLSISQASINEKNELTDDKINSNRVFLSNVIQNNINSDEKIIHHVKNKSDATETGLINYDKGEKEINNQDIDKNRNFLKDLKSKYLLNQSKVIIETDENKKFTEKIKKESSKNEDSFFEKENIFNFNISNNEIEMHPNTITIIDKNKIFIESFEEKIKNDLKINTDKLKSISKTILDSSHSSSKNSKTSYVNELEADNKIKIEENVSENNKSIREVENKVQNKSQENSEDKNSVNKDSNIKVERKASSRKKSVFVLRKSLTINSKSLINDLSHNINKNSNNLKNEKFEANDENKEKTIGEYHLSYFTILQISFFPWLASSQKIIKHHNKLMEAIQKITDYEEICSEVALIKDSN